MTEKKPVVLQAENIEIDMGNLGAPPKKVKLKRPSMVCSICAGKYGSKTPSKPPIWVAGMQCNWCKEKVPVTHCVNFGLNDD